MMLLLVVGATTITTKLQIAFRPNKYTVVYDMEQVSNDDSYKLRKEQFVFGLEGTNPCELLFICSTSFVGVVGYYLIFNGSHTNNVNSQIQTHYEKLPLMKVKLIFGEVLCFFVPMILCQTIWIYPYGIGYVAIQLLLSILLLANKIKQTPLHQVSSSTTTSTSSVITKEIIQQLQRVTVTIYRGCILLFTIISILGIDFHIYPRRFGKTEITGYSLMDLGAASFVIMAAVSSSSSLSSPSHILTERIHQIPRTNASRHKFHKQLRKMIPLLVMGTLRLLTHKGIEYPEHHSEYGIHWNFFYTLAFLIPITSFIKSYGYTPKNHPNGYVPILIFITYQYVLSYYGLQDFIVHAPRTCPVLSTTTTSSFLTHIVCDMWYANREGIVGCISYTALYLLSEYIADNYFWKYNNTKQSVDQSSTTGITNNELPVPVWETAKPLWFSVMVLFVCWQVLVSLPWLPLDVSRRSTNAIFCIWVLFVNLFQLVSIYTVVLLSYNSISKSSNAVSSIKVQSPILLSSMNRNGLYIFIIANLCTGIINLSIDTLTVSNSVAIWILLLYVGTVGSVSLLLDRVKRYFNERKFSKSKETIKLD